MNAPHWLKRITNALDPWVGVFGSPEDVSSFHLYRYEWIDFHDYEKPAEEVLSGWNRAGEFIAALRERWLSAGWRGDGEITTIWIPPFCVDSLDTPTGLIVWHVKQLEDGTSWLASAVPLPFFAP